MSEPGFVYLDGEIVAAERARLSPFDRGFLYGDGIFETMRVYNRSIHLLRRHLVRLRDAASYLRLPLPHDAELIDALRATIEANGLVDCTVRLTVTRGEGRSLYYESIDSATIVVFLRALPTISETDPEETAPGEGALGEGALGEGALGEGVISLRSRFHPPSIGTRVKALNYLTAIYSGAELRSSSVREGLLLTEDGRVAEGTVSNFFSVIGGTLVTASLQLGVLPGITRGRVMELAANRGIAVHEEAPTRDIILKHASECFYTNSVREIVPVVGIDGVTVGTGRPGGITLQLLNDYRAEAPDEHL